MMEESPANVYIAPQRRTTIYMHKNESTGAFGSK